MSLSRTLKLSPSGRRRRHRPRRACLGRPGSSPPCAPPCASPGFGEVVLKPPPCGFRPAAQNSVDDLLAWPRAVGEGPRDRHVLELRPDRVGDAHRRPALAAHDGDVAVLPDRSGIRGADRWPGPPGPVSAMAWAACCTLCTTSSGVACSCCARVLPIPARTRPTTRAAVAVRRDVTRCRDMAVPPRGGRHWRPARRLRQEKIHHPLVGPAAPALSV